jgi:hypothetical protein
MLKYWMSVRYQDNSEMFAVLISLKVHVVAEGGISLDTSIYIQN